MKLKGLQDTRLSWWNLGNSVVVHLYLSHKRFGWMDDTQVGAGSHNPGRGWAGIE